MKVFIVFAAVIAASVAAPNSYGYQVVRTTTLPPPPPPPRYEAPKYEAPKYEAPKVAYEAPKSYDSYGKMAAKVEQIPIITHTFDTDHKGNYRLELETGNGIRGHSQGTLKDIGAKEGPIVAKQGTYSYVGDDGKTYAVNWSADESGFHATGDHLPTAPPMPEEIRKSLEVPRIPEFQPEHEQERERGQMKSSYGYASHEVRQPSYSSYAPAPAPAGPPAPVPIRSSY